MRQALWVKYGVQPQGTANIGNRQKVSRQTINKPNSVKQLYFNNKRDYFYTFQRPEEASIFVNAVDSFNSIPFL